MCTNNPFIIDDVRKHVFCSSCGEQHLAALCHDLTGIAYRRIETTGISQNITVNLKEQQAIAIEIERYAAASGQRHLTELGHN